MCVPATREKVGEHQPKNNKNIFAKKFIDLQFAEGQKVFLYIVSHGSINRLIIHYISQRTADPILIINSNGKL